MNEPIQQKTPKPPGLLPKHVQSWLILGLAVLMIVIMWLTGGKKQQNAAKASAPVAPQPLPVVICLQHCIELSQNAFCNADRITRTVHIRTRLTSSNSSDHAHRGCFTLANAQGRTARQCLANDLGHSTQRCHFDSN